MSGGITSRVTNAPIHSGSEGPEGVGGASGKSSMAVVLRRPLFEGAVFELATDAGALRFFSVERVMHFRGEGGLGGEWSSLFVAEEEVYDLVCLGKGECSSVWVGRCSGVRVIPVDV